MKDNLLIRFKGQYVKTNLTIQELNTDLTSIGRVVQEQEKEQTTKALIARINGASVKYYLSSDCHLIIDFIINNKWFESLSFQKFKTDMAKSVPNYRIVYCRPSMLKLIGEKEIQILDKNNPEEVQTFSYSETNLEGEGNEIPG